MNSVIDILGKLSAIMTSLLVIGGFFMSITKWGKTILGNWINKVLKGAFKNELEPIVRGMENNSAAIKCVLRRDIIKLCALCREKQSITSKELECLIDANEAYVALKGNSFVHDLVEDAKSLPLKDN